MIICLEGRSGSGKSYEAVKIIVDRLKVGRIVVTNIEGIDDRICREHIKLLANLSDYELETRLIFVPYNEIYTFWKKKEVAGKSNVIFIIDECHKYFSNRSWQKETNIEFANWSSTHRKGGDDLILITQSISKIDSHVRSNINGTYQYKKMNMFGRLFTNGYRERYFEDDDVETKPFETKIKKYDPKIFRCYMSYSTKQIQELGIGRVKNVFRHPVFFFIPICFAIAVYMIFFKSSFATGDVFGTKKMLDKANTFSAKNAAVEIAKSKDTVSVSSSSPVPSPVVMSYIKPELDYKNYVSVKSECSRVGFVSFDNKEIEDFLCNDYRVSFKNRKLTSFKEVKKAEGFNAVGVSPLPSPAS